jgi:hypothetical protein
MAADVTPSPIPDAFRSTGAGGVPGRKSVLRERFDAMKQVAIDDAMDKKDSWAKQVGNGSSGVKLDDIPRLVQILGLKLVDARRICITPEKQAEYEACRTLAARLLAPAPPKLEFDDE